VPFGAVDAAFAAAEGEGDRSLAWWQAAHTAYFAGCWHDSAAAWTTPPSSSAALPPASAPAMVTDHRHAPRMIVLWCVAHD